MSNETSMEDILSSIKRIIAEEGDAALQSPRPRKSAAKPSVSRSAGSDDAILELSELASEPAVETGPAEAGLQDDPTDHAPPIIETITAPMPDIAESKPGATAETILSKRTAEASVKSLEALSRMMVKPEHPGSDTLEGMVREMLRPMLREWLDAHLPDMVETMVAREIKRITGRDE